jgi:copper homeostasis protein
MMTPVLIEACVDSLAGALAAQEGGAGRIELCASLEVGGLTPAPDLVAECASRLSIPVFVLVRPAPGSFVLSPAGLTELLGQIRAVGDSGAAGIVAGAITASGAVDLKAVEAIVAAAHPLPVTFHRAFDELEHQWSALDTLVGLGVARVLTAGAAPTAEEGAVRIKQLVGQSAGRIGIVAGGTVRAHNVSALVWVTGVTEVHSRTPVDPEGVRALVAAANAA